MKTSTFLAFILLLCLSTQAARIDSKPVPSKQTVANMSEEEKKARLEEIKLRVNDIKEMDRSTLTSSERKALRKELRTMKKEADSVRGIYLSVGAIIIIILLLILIL